MAVRIKFDSTHNVIQPTFVLATRSGKKLGVIRAENIEVSDSMNTYFELSFQVQKEVDSKKCALWDKIEDFKLLWCREWNVWFEIYVELSEGNNTVKNISAISLGEAELSQTMLTGVEINTETDIARDDYDEKYPTLLYRDDHTEASLLHRLLEKAPHYSIKHVDVSIRNQQRTFSFDGISLYDAFLEIAEEINCIFVINSGTNSSGKIAREINVYDMESYCLDCGHRDSYFKTCPKCNSNNVLNGYGQDTTIFVSTDNLADNITYSTDKDSVKNCFKLEAGDDLMTAAIRSCNPNGSSYIWYVSDLMRRDMSNELVNRLDEYDRIYDYYQNDYEIVFSGNELAKYNELVTKYFQYNSNLETIPEKIVGYPTLMTTYYNTIDLYLYLRSGLMPTVKMQDTSANEEVLNLSRYLTNTTVSVRNLESCSSSTASSAVLSVARVVVDSRYQVKVKNGVFENNKWTGIITVTNYSDEEDTATSESIIVNIDDNEAEYVKQKIDKALASDETDETTGIVALFKLDLSDFKAEIKKYGLTSIESFRDACQTCLDILIEQGISNKETWADKNPNLYEELYLPYYNKNLALLNEVKLREEEISIIVGKYDSDGFLEVPGLQNIIEDDQVKIQDTLNFEKFLGTELWLDFIAYRREDTYSNSNYISDGLNNKEIFKYALEFIEVAKKEIYKSATLQHSITATLKNLLVMKEFEPIVQYFSVGNWIRVRVNDEVYRLRLISYTIDFNNLDNISIEFSDVLKCANGTSDVESVLNQAASMATHFDTVSRQASKGSKSNQQLEDWVDKGLALTKMKIVDDADEQNITWDDHGMLFRQRIPLTDTYDDKQMKAINKGLYLTDDNWLTSKAGIGNFVYYNPKTGKYEEAYGVIADTLIGNLILSEEVGIYNTENSITLDENGLIITTDDTSDNAEDVNKMAFTIQKKVKDVDGNEEIKKLLYINDDGDLVLNGSVRVNSSNGGDAGIDSPTLNESLENAYDDSAVIEKITQLEQTCDGINMSVKEVEESLEETTTTIYDELAKLEIKNDGINASVQRVETTLQDNMDSISNDMDVLSKRVDASMTSEQVEIAIKTELENGTSKVTTNTGFTFNDEGLTVSKSGSEMTTQITEDGMTVYKNDKAVLTANNEGVDAVNLHASTYLIIGKYSRFEDYGEKRTGCFWIGGNT